VFEQIENARESIIARTEFSISVVHKLVRTGGLAIITTGGTIDKLQSRRHATFAKKPYIFQFLRIQPTQYSNCLTPLAKDSLDVTDQERLALRDLILERPETSIIVTHGTDTVIETAQSLGKVTHATIIFTGAMRPGCHPASDARENIMFAISQFSTTPDRRLSRIRRKVIRAIKLPQKL